MKHRTLMIILALSIILNMTLFFWDKHTNNEVVYRQNGAYTLAINLINMTSENLEQIVEKKMHTKIYRYPGNISKK